MATEAQMNANRANAQKSTGPTSDTGKARVSQNALKTGIYAESEVTKHENAEQLIQLTTEYYNQHQPATPEARQMVDELIQSAWRTRRINRGEARLWDYLFSQTESTPEDLREGHALFLASAHLARIERMLQSVSRRSRQIEDKLDKLEANQPEPAPAPQPEPEPAPQPEPEPEPAPAAAPVPEPPATAEPSTAQAPDFQTTSPEIGFVSSSGERFESEGEWRAFYRLSRRHPLNHRECPNCRLKGRNTFYCHFEPKRRGPSSDDGASESDNAA